MNTERLAERETLLHRLGSKLNRTVFNSCGNPIFIRSGKTRDFSGKRAAGPPPVWTLGYELRPPAMKSGTNGVFLVLYHQA